MKFTTAFAALCVMAIQVTAIPAKRDGDGPTGSTSRGCHIYSPVADLFLSFFFWYSDVEVLNFALTLEHLENAFYTEGLKKYNQQAFINAGLPKWVRGRFEQIAMHGMTYSTSFLPLFSIKCGRIIIEATHVAFLETALGSQAVKPCEYNLYVFIHAS
jgi:hypothetical protein